MATTTMQAPDAAAAPTEIEAFLTYAVDTGVKPVNETFGPANTMRKRTGATNEQAVHIRNGRPMRDTFKLDVNGFEFVDHKTQMKSFYDPEEIKSIYYREAEELIKKVSGASRVVIFDHTVRNGDEKVREEKLLREPVLSVHNDYTEWSGPQRVRDVLPDEAEELLKKRFAIIQIWRAINTPIQSNPLAIADARSLPTKDLIAAERRYPNRVGETYWVSYNPDHDWYYFPLMARDEALVFKVYESAKDGRARFTAHTSFNDPTTPAGAPPRESIEIRSIAFFDEDVS